MKDKKDTGEGCIAALIMIAIFPFAMAWRGYALSILWGWFIVPVFALPALGMWQAAGVSCIASFLTAQRTGRSKDENPLTDVIAIFLYPLIALIFGWVIWQFAK